MGMSLKKFYIFSLINLSMTMVVIICYYENVERKYIFIAFFILSIISNILTITIMNYNYNDLLMDILGNGFFGNGFSYISYSFTASFICVKSYKTKRH